MSTVLIVIIVVVVAAILIGVVLSMSRRARAKRELGNVQVEAQHDDVAHHRAQADESRGEAELAEERAKRAGAEAELNERQADQREQEIDAEN